MPTKHASIKDLRKTRRRTARNLRLKTHLRHLLKTAQAQLKEGKKSEARDAVRRFQQAADKAAKNRVFSQNAAKRKKSALMQALVKIN